MSIFHWKNDDSGYLAWKESHPDGFLANIFNKRTIPGRQFKIHRASCQLPDRSKPETVNPWTGSGYAKVTADSLDELIQWGHANGFQLSTSDFCARCKPANAVTVLEQKVFNPLASKAAIQEVLDSDFKSDKKQMRYWWVNQNQTYKSEVPAGFLWSPKTRADGGRNQFYENMHQVAVGDIVFSFCDTRIKAIGVAIGRAEPSPKPDFGAAGASWSQEGWLVPIEFKELRTQTRPKDHIALIRPYLPAKYSPLQNSGDGLQSVYLAEIPVPMAEVLAALIGEEFLSTLKELQGETDDVDIVGDLQEESIKGRTDIGATTKDQLVKSRRGQDVFKANVRLNEKGCRITGVTDPQHLRASHIKPWKDSTDEEKLNGCDGLLLAPHIDHLFDKGLISFSDRGDLLTSPKLDRGVLTKWGISEGMNVGRFNTNQSVFLEYHRHSVFKKR